MMKFNIEDFDEVCTHFGFDSYPRTVGNPRQTLVYAAEEAYLKFSRWNGNSPCFISTGGYSNIHFDMGGKQNPRSIHHSLTFFDFDHETKPENAFADAQRLSEFLREMDIAHWVQYSGSKGYHLFIIHAPTKFKFDYRDGSNEALKQILHQTQDHLRQTLGLNTLDEQTMGDPKRLCRFPYSLHVDRFGKASGRHALPVPIEELDFVNHDDIVMRACSVEHSELPEIIGRRLTLKEFIRELGVRLDAPETQIRPVVGGDFDFGDSGKEALRFISSLEHRCMGVVNELRRRNPPHKARVFAALFAKTLGLPQQSFERVWMSLGTSMGYVDLHNHEHRAYQMATIFDNPNYHSFPTCTTLKANGCCVGEICPRYAEMEQILYQPKQVQRKWSSKSGGNKDTEIREDD